MNSLGLNLQTGDKIFEIIQDIQNQKKYELDYQFNLQSRCYYLDCDCSEEYLLMTTAKGITILKHGYDISIYAEKPHLSIHQSKWLPIDPSVFFTISSNEIKLWDSNTLIPISSFLLTESFIIEPHIGDKPLIIVCEQNTTTIKDYRTWESIGSLNAETSCVKWSPYDHEYFITGSSTELKLFDLRKLRQPVCSFGFPDTSQVRKKTKFALETNAYDSFFVSTTKNTFNSNLISIDFSEDGRYLLVMITDEVFCIDMLHGYDLPKKVLNYHSNFRPFGDFVRYTKGGAILGIANKLIAFNQNYNAMQELYFQSNIVGAYEIRTEEFLYVVDREGKLSRWSLCI
ncbi:hypothetical protein SteCoe_2857 [Stentor coeruleus]|uniref:Anaphase-promoting complex subunit 4 WD40 domain-containing protein n=1 Tax=Stentor coeruleus TaxID=5963 RepID=A0A1R2CYM6_9CILI|nr:hypothetical protein SteCoe_2857 [Stentor coeruleus]